MSRAIVLLSGGQDSVTCLFLAAENYKSVHALTINYGQRHAVELQAARTAAMIANVATHEIIDLPQVLVSRSPLTDRSKEVGQYESVSDLPGGVEPTFVPGRNILFLTLAGNRLASIDAEAIYIGVSQEDFGGYWDCRGEFIEAMQEALESGLYGSRRAVPLLTPLLDLDKRETVLTALSMAQRGSRVMEALAHSHTCYRGDVPPCQKCHACLLRAKGFAAAGVADPLVERLQKEGKL